MTGGDISTTMIALAGLLLFMVICGAFMLALLIQERRGRGRRP